jgi:hypothetical protein
MMTRTTAIWQYYIVSVYIYVCVCERERERERAVANSNNQITSAQVYIMIIYKYYINNIIFVLCYNCVIYDTILYELKVYIPVSLMPIIGYVLMNV